MDYIPHQSYRSFMHFAFGVLLIAAVLPACNNKKVQWPEPTAEAKPWTRWWWPGNAVDRENISRELSEMAAAGISGVEITSIYGVRGEEERFIEYLSPEYTEALKFTLEEAKRQGMGVDLPPGSGWRMGGPFVPREKGLWSLKMHRFSINKGQEWKLPADILDAEMISFIDDEESAAVIEKNKPFEAPRKGKVYVAEAVNNGDRVKRASAGGTGFAVNTFNEEITTWYLHEFENRLGIDDGLVRSFFHDSFEYTGDFTTGFSEEFKKRRGYDLALWLHVLAGDSKDAGLIARIRADYRMTLADLVLESFIQPMTEWTNSHQAMNRNQAHGSPGNILDLYAACDIPETEIFGRIEPGTVNVFVNKFASSAAHITGQKLVSSESFTWLGEHWTVTPAEMMRATNRLLLSGVNHMLFHGTCYSPQDVEWPGWLFYASTQINNRNPLWRELPALFKYIERSQTILQQAEPQNDLLVYWPWHDVAASQEGSLFFKTNIDRGDKASWFSDYPLATLSQELTDAGYTFDYISDSQLQNCRALEGEIVTEGKAKYKAVVIPRTRYIPVNTMQILQKFIGEGARVFFSDSLPESVPGRFNLEGRQQDLQKINAVFDSARIAGIVPQLINASGIPGEIALADRGFRFSKFKWNNEIWYMIFNCNTQALDEWVKLNTSAGSYLFYFPENGEVARAEAKDSTVRIQLESERAVFVRCTADKMRIPYFAYLNPSVESREVEGLWKIRFLTGGPVFPGDLSVTELDSWTRLGDENTTRFAGTARYTIEFDWNDKAETGLLDLGNVKDCAHVVLNGKDYGSLLGPAFKVKVDNLERGKNLLEVEVTNVAANRIRDLDRRKVNWKKFHDINFVNIDYKPFDASGWEVREAGLLGKVELTVLDVE